MNDPVTITRMADEPYWPQGGAMTWRVRVTFYDGEHGPFSLLFDKEGFSGIAARSAVEAYVRELRIVRGV